MGSVGIVMAVYVCAIMVVLLALVTIGVIINKDTHKEMEKEDKKFWDELKKYRLENEEAEAAMSLANALKNDMT